LPYLILSNTYLVSFIPCFTSLYQVSQRWADLDKYMYLPSDGQPDVDAAGKAISSLPGGISDYKSKRMTVRHLPPVSALGHGTVDEMAEDGMFALRCVVTPHSVPFSPFAPFCTVPFLCGSTPSHLLPFFFFDFHFRHDSADAILLAFRFSGAVRHNDDGAGHRPHA
jgi:hypothetical protein